MSLVETRRTGDVVEVRMARAPVNAMNDALLTDLLETLRAEGRGPARAIVLSGLPGVFSAGLDVPALMAKDAAGMKDFWRLFFDVQRALAGSPVPVVAAITGHSPAGGAVFAMYCDYRIMAEGAFKIGLNEVAVGIHPGPVLHAVLKRLVGTRHAELLMGTARMMTPVEAQRFGFVDELVAPVGVVDRAIAWAQQTLQLPASAYLATRAIARADLIELVRTAGLEAQGSPGDHWWDPETQAVLTMLVHKLRKK
ncbi:MAG TPA: enoyl-CoA hydratase/isomerase family protein [Steroidobacteraceae bacterium]|nr:enoyl-CoA hydratase/isomerase family protein [Steroidobacteraceae bacterium]